MAKAKSELIEYKKDRENNDKYWIYEVSHSNGKTTLAQDLKITKKGFFSGYTGTIGIEDFPEFNSKKECAKKLADWLQRLSWAINSGIKHGVYDD